MSVKLVSIVDPPLLTPVVKSNVVVPPFGPVAFLTTVIWPPWVLVKVMMVDPPAVTVYWPPWAPDAVTPVPVAPSKNQPVGRLPSEMVYVPGSSVRT